MNNDRSSGCGRSSTANLLGNRSNKHLHSVLTIRDTHACNKRPYSIFTRTHTYTILFHTHLHDRHTHKHTLTLCYYIVCTSEHYILCEMHITVDYFSHPPPLTQRPCKAQKQFLVVREGGIEKAINYAKRALYILSPNPLLPDYCSLLAPERSTVSTTVKINVRQQRQMNDILEFDAEWERKKESEAEWVRESTYTQRTKISARKNLGHHNVRT